MSRKHFTLAWPGIDLGKKGELMFTKLKTWLLGDVILKKVVGKFAKHATGAIIGLLASPQVAPWLTSLGVSIDETQLTAGLIVALTGAFGSIWNFVEHRIK